LYYDSRGEKMLVWVVLLCVVIWVPSVICDFYVTEYQLYKEGNLRALIKIL